MEDNRVRGYVLGYKAAYGLLYDGSIVWQRVREQHNGAWKAHSDILRVD